MTEAAETAWYAHGFQEGMKCRAVGLEREHKARMARKRARVFHTPRFRRAWFLGYARGLRAEILRNPPQTIRSML